MLACSQNVILHKCYVINLLFVCSTKQEDQFRDFVYLSQVIQAICIDAEAQHYRRMISTDGIFTRGTLYWQLVHIMLITRCMS